MALVQTLTASFKSELFQAVHNLLTDTVKIALYTGNASLSASTTAYTTSYEASGGGYTAGGLTLTGVTVQTSGSVAYVSFDSPVWTSASFTCRGALLYNASKSNKSIAVLDFGADKTAQGRFVVTMPVNTSTTALIRI